MNRRWIVAAAALLAIEMGMFYAWNRDLVVLSRVPETLAADPAFGDLLLSPGLARGREKATVTYAAA